MSEDKMWNLNEVVDHVMRSQGCSKRQARRAVEKKLKSGELKVEGRPSDMKEHVPVAPSWIGKIDWDKGDILGPPKVTAKATRAAMRAAKRGKKLSPEEVRRLMDQGKLDEIFISLLDVLELTGLSPEQLLEELTSGRLVATATPAWERFKAEGGKCSFADIDIRLDRLKSWMFSAKHLHTDTH